MKLILALATAAVLAGCSQTPTEPTSGSGNSVSSANPSGSTTTATNANATTAPPQTPPGPPQVAKLDPPPKAAKAPKNPTPVEQRQPKDGDEVAVLDTSMGKVVLMFFPDKAPNHVANFKYLAQKGFYDGTKFHRIIPNFMIQGGDPFTKSGDPAYWGSGGPGYTIDAEFNDVHHAPGILSMARTSDPNSAGSQFFIVVKDSGFLDHQYTAFGKVVSGMDVVEKIKAVPTGAQDRPDDPPVVKSVKIEKWPVK